MRRALVGLVLCLSAQTAFGRDRTASLVNQHGNHNKFYVLRQSGADVFMAWGKIGARKTFQKTLHLKSSDAAVREFGRRLAVRLRHQYVDESLKIDKRAAPAARSSTTSAVVANRKKFGIETKTVHAVSYGDLEELIKEVYGREYELVAGEEWGNDSQHEFSVDGKNDKWDQQTVDEFRAGKTRNYATRAILNDLVKGGHLAPGTYLVDVSW